MYLYRKMRAFQTNLGEKYISSKEFRWMIMQNMVIMFHSPPHFEFQFIQHNHLYITRYSVSTILTNLMYLRFFLVLRLIPNLSKWIDINSEDCCEAEGIEADFSFALKSLLKDKPYQMLLINFSISVISFGLSVRAFER